MANKETRVLKQDTLEILRQKTNEISLHVGDNEQLDALLADKTYSYTASAGQVLFDGADNNSKVTRFELSPQHTIDNTGGSIILEGVSSLDASYVANAIIYQGSSGSESWSATIVSASVNKIIVRDSTGTFSSSADLKVGTGSPDTIANANIARIIIESYPVAIARVYNNNTELTQGMAANGFFAPKIAGVSAISNSPSVGNSFSEGVTVYQNGSSLSTQGDIESDSNWYGVLHSVDSSEIRFKTSQGSFSATAKLRVLGSADEIAAADHGALTAVDSTYGSYIELTTPAANTNTIKVFSLDLVAAINELQDDIGTVENLTTSANDVVLAINEHDAELGTITALAMGTTASTVSSAIAEHETQIGNVDITDISSSNDTITGALEQIHDEIGDVTASNLGTSASNLTAAVREHEDQIGSESISTIDSGDSNNTITGALNQLHTEVGSLSLNTTATDLTAAINEHEGDIGNMSLTGLTATDLSAAIRELRVELGNHLEIDDATGYSATTAVGGIKEIQGDIGDVDDLDTNAVSDLVAAINELENVLRDDTTQRTGYVMGTDANNVVAAINEIETFLRGTNSDYTITTAAANVRDALREHESQIGNMVFGASGPVDAVNSTTLTGAINVLDAEIGNTNYNSMGTDISTALLNVYNDINTTNSLTTLQTTNKFIVGAINEIDADLFNAVGSERRTMSDLSTTDKTSIVDAINEIYADIHTSGSVTLDTDASHLVGAINEIEAVFDASAKNITAGTNAFLITSGAFTVNSDGNIKLDNGSNHTILQADGVEYGRFTKSGTDFQLKAGHLGALFLTASGQNATFANNLTVSNDLIVTNNVDIEGNVDVNGSIETDGLSINGTTVTATAAELNIMDGNTAASSTTIADADRVVVNDNGTMKQVAVTDLAAYFDDEITNMPNLVQSGALNSGSITSGFGSINIGTSTLNAGIITGTQFRIGNAQIVEAELETIDGVVAGTVGASKVVVVDANKDITGFRNITLSGELDAGSLDISGNVDTDGTLDVALGSTLRGAVSITNNTASSSSATGALTVAGGVGIGEDLYVAGDLYVEGTRTELNVTTLEVEDTLVLAGNDLSSEPTSGGFGLEVGPITSPSGVASGVTGAHSIVYNYATDRWEADGSLILSQATLGSPNIEGQAFESGDNLDFTASNGVSVTTSKSGTTHTVLYQNTDRGSSQSIFKNIVAGGVTISAESNNDTLTFTDDGVINALASGTTDDAIALSHADVFTGTAGNFGQVNAQDGQYIKSLTLTAEGHVSAITTGDFDTRYEASDPAWNLKVSGTQIDPVNNGDSVDFAVSSVDGVAGLTITSSTDNTDSVITLAHANTSSIGNLASNNSDGTVIQDLTLTYDTYGHALTRSVGTVNLDNRYIRSFVVEDGDGSKVTINQANEWKFVEGSGTGATIDINWTDITPGSDTDPYDLTFTVNNTDRGSSQNIFKNIAVTDTDSGYSYAETGTVVADSNNDTVTFVSGGAIDIDVDATNDAIRISHSDTSSASSSNNSGRTYIQDITIDTYGHVTGIGTATETYSYTHPTYNGDDFSIDTGPLTGATVISDLDINVTTDSIGSVVDANGTVATRNLTLGDLGFAGWDVEVNGTHVADIGNNGDVDFKNGNHTTAVWTASGNRIQWNHNTFTSGGTTYGNNGTTVLSQVIVDGYGHTRAWQTTDLTSHFDDYSSWSLTADSGGTATIGSGNTVDIEGGTSISTVRSGNKVTVNFVDPGYLTSQRTATLTAVNSGADGNDPILRLSDGSNSDIRITDSGSVTVTYTNSGAINIHGTDNNTDVDVSVANLTSRLAQTSGTINIGDTSVSDNTIVIRGNLTVQGTQTTANAEVLQISDNKILLNYDYPNQAPTEDAFFEVERGSYVNSYIQWNENTNRWQFAEGDTSMTLRNFSRAPDDANLTRFYIRPDDNSNIEITKDEVLAIDGGTAISTDFVTVNSGESHRLQINHENVTRDDPPAGSATLSYGNNFSAVTGVTSNAQGHITAVNTSQFTMPSAYSLPLASSATRGGIKVGYSENGKNYPVELASEKAYVNVPWTDTNTFRTVSVDTNGDGSVNNTLGASETLVLKKGSNISLSESGGIVTISSTDTNTVTRVKASNGTLQSGDITIAASGSASVSQSGNTITINATDTNTTYGVAAANTLGLIEVGYTTNSGARNYAVQLSGNDAYVNVPWTDTNTNTFRTVSVDTNGDGSVNNTLGATETLTFKKGSNITLSESGGVITISSTDTNTDTFLNDVSVVDNGANIILRHTMSNSTSHDIGITAGTGITLTEGTDTFAIASTTNLSFSRTSSALTVTSSNGNNVTLPAADANGPGLLTVGGHTLLSTIDTNANQNIAGNGISLTNSDKTINLDYDQRLPYSSGTHVKVGHSGTNGKSYLDFNVATASGDSGYIDVYTSADGLSGELLNFKFEGDGDFHAAGDVIAFSATTASDVKLKENIERVEGALEKVSQLDGVKFTWKKDGKESAGVIAQNVEKVLPSAVKEVETLDGEEINKHVDYNQLSALFIEAIKELKEENKLLRDEIENLKSINS